MRSLGFKIWLVFCSVAMLTTVTIVPFIAASAILTLPTQVLAETNTVTSTVTGTTTVDKTPATASAPNIVINNQDICTSAASAAVQTQILGVATGVTITDENCERLKLARSLYGMGMKVAAVSLLCQDERVFDAMQMAGTPCPYDGRIGEQAKALWEAEQAKKEQKNEEAKRDEDTVPTHWFISTIGLLLFLL